MNEYHHETIDLGTVCKDTIRARIQPPYLVYLYDGTGHIGYLATAAGLYPGASTRSYHEPYDERQPHEAGKRTRQLRLDRYVP
jgi:hypothetical protein